MSKDTEMKNEEVITEFIEIFKSFDLDDQFEFFMETQEILRGFILLDKRDERKIYFRETCKNDNEFRLRHNARQRKYYQKQNKKSKQIEKLEKMDLD